MNVSVNGGGGGDNVLSRVFKCLLSKVLSGPHTMVISDTKETHYKCQNTQRGLNDLNCTKMVC